MTADEDRPDDREEPDEPDDDAEIEAIAGLARILRPLRDEQRTRVIEWAAKRYGTRLAERPAAGAAAVSRIARADEQPALPTYEHFAELHNRVQPSTDIERALTASYWVQEVDGKKPFGSIEVNARLREMSAGVSHMAEAMSGLQSRRPALVIQLRKSGRTRQARKSYQVTPEGVAAVRAAIARGGFRVSDGEGDR